MNSNGITIKHIQEASDKGGVEFQPGCWLVTAEQMIEDQKKWDDGDESKHTDFSGSDFWITTDNGFLDSFDKKDAINIFGRMTEDGNVRVFNADGTVCTRLLANYNVWDVNSGKSTAYEHPEGIVIEMKDAEELDIDIED